MQATLAIPPTELGEWGRKIVEVYMQWYTFFVTANLLIMGWFHSKDVKVERRKSLVALARLFQLFNVLGAVSTAMVGYYVALNVPNYAMLIHWAAFSNGVALLGTAYVWNNVIPKES